MPHDVFISYSSHDKLLADATCATLEAQNIRCWIAPRNAQPGAEWAEDIVNAITDCRVVVLVFSAKANDSPQVRREVERAISKGKILVPLRAEDVLPSKAMELFLPSTHWLDAFPPPPEPHLKRLSAAVKAFLGNEPRNVIGDATQDRGKEKAPEHGRLGSTQKKVLSILEDGPQYFAEIIRSLRDIHGSETRTSEVRRLIQEMVKGGVVVVGDDDRHSLTKHGLELSAASQSVEVADESELVIKIDSRLNNESKGKTLRMPYTPDQPVYDFLNEVYYFLAPGVEQFSFGKTWMLVDADTEKPFQHLQSGFDQRSLFEVGVKPGAVLLVKLL